MNLASFPHGQPLAGKRVDILFSTEERREYPPPCGREYTIMRTIRQLEKKRWTRFCPISVLAYFAALAVFFSWLPAQAGQPSLPGKVLHLDVHGLELLLQSDPNLLLIDVRAPEELTGPLGKIPQSRNVTLQEIEKNPQQFPRDKTLVLICRTGHRSLEAANFLAEHSYFVYSVQGGMQAWRKLHALAPPPKGEPPKELGASGRTPDVGK